MIWIRFFPYAVASLQLTAALVYLWHREYRLAIIWGAVSLFNIAFAGIK